MKKILVFVFMLSVTIAFSELKLQWRFKVGDIVNSCPAIADDGTVYFGSWDGNLYALTNDGKVKWAYNVGNIINTSVAIGEDGTIYFGSDDGYLYALSPNKELKWKFKTTRAISATPAIGIDGTIYIGGNDKYFYAINPNGSLKWKIELGGKISASAVIDSEGIIYIGSEDGSLYAITEEGQIIWTFQAKGSITNSVAIDKAGIIYLGDRRGNVYAIDREGKVIWTSMIGGTILSGIIIDEEGNLYFTTSDARIRSLNKKGEERWVINFSRNTSTTGIILKNGKIYFAIDEKIVGITKEGKVIEEYNIGERTGMGINYWKDTIYVGSFDSSVYAIKTEASEQGGQYSKFGVNSKNQGDLMEKDNQNPIVMITNIEQGELVEEGERVIKIKYEDNQRVKYIEIYEDNKEIKKEVINKKEGEYEFTWNTGEAGKKEIKVIAYDIAGNKGEARVLIRVEKVKKNEAPGKPRNISPKEGEVIEKQTVVLEWESEDPEGDELRYDIYFGLDSNPPLIMSGYTGNRYEVVNLETGKTYYWKIVARDSELAETESDLWSFRVNIVIKPEDRLKWKFQADRWIYSSPVIGQDGTIYVGSTDSYLYAISSDGKLKWKFQTNESIYSSPAIGPDGTIYVGSDDNYLYAISSDGKLKWKFQTNGDISSSPAIGSDGTIYVGSYDKCLYAIKFNGTLKWKFETNRPILSSPAVGEDGTVYVGSYDGYVYAINPDGKLKWKFQTGDWILSSPVIGPDGTIYIGSNDNYLYAISPDGKLKWKFQTGDDIRSSPLVGLDGTIYVGSDDNYMYAISPDGKLKWKFQTGDWIFSSPTMGVDGTIYIGSYDTNIYAIYSDSKGIANSSWPKFRKDLQNTGRVANIINQSNNERSIQNLNSQNIGAENQVASSNQIVSNTEERKKSSFGLSYGRIYMSTSEYSTDLECVSIYFGQFNYASFTGWRLFFGKGWKYSSYQGTPISELNLSYITYFDVLISLGIGVGFGTITGPYIAIMAGYGLPIPNVILFGVHVWSIYSLTQNVGILVDISIVWSF